MMVNGIGKKIDLILDKEEKLNKKPLNIEPLSNTINFIDKKIAEFNPKEFKNVNLDLIKNDSFDPVTHKFDLRNKPKFEDIKIDEKNKEIFENKNDVIENNDFDLSNLQTISKSGGNLTYDKNNLKIKTSVTGLGSETTELDILSRIKLDDGKGAHFNSIASYSMGGVKDGSIILASSYQTKPTSYIKNYDEGNLKSDITDIQWGATAGYSKLPNLKGKLSQDIYGKGTKTDLLGNPSTNTDYGSQGLILGGNFDYSRENKLAGNSSLFLKNKIDLLAYVPIETDPIIKALNSKNTNGAFPFSDLGQVLGMSSVDISTELGITHSNNNGNFSFSYKGYTNDFNDPTFALKSGDLLTNFIYTEHSIDAKYSSKDEKLNASVHVPLKSTSYDDVASATVGYNWQSGAAQLTGKLNKNPTIEVNVANKLDPNLVLSANCQTDFKNNIQAAVGLGVGIGDLDLKMIFGSERDKMLSTKNAKVNFYTTDNTAVPLPPGISTGTFSNAVSLLDTPEKISSYIRAPFTNTATNPKPNYMEYIPHNDRPEKFSAQETFEHNGGICADLHIFASSMLKKHGYESYVVQVAARNTAHDFTVFKEKDSNGNDTWSVLQYNNIFRFQSDSPLDAVNKVFPDLLNYKLVDPDSLVQDKAGKTENGNMLKGDISPIINDKPKEKTEVIM